LTVVFKSRKSGKNNSDFFLRIFAKLTEDAKKKAPAIFVVGAFLGKRR
jgi:hypothetical protein